MGRKRKTRWRRLSIGEISANEDEDGELGVAVISLTRSHSHSASQNHSPARHPSDKSLSAITMTNNNKDSSSSSPSLHTSSTNLSSAPGGGGGNLTGSGGTNPKLFSNSSSTTPTVIPDKSSQNATPCSSSSPNPHSQSNSGYHNGHNHVPSSYNNSTHPPPNSVSSNESTSSSTGGGGAGGGGHYNDRYHYTRENYRPPHHHHHNHNSHHNSNYNGPSSSHYQGNAEGGNSSRGERGSGYHYSGHPHSHKEYQNGYHHGPGHYSGYQGNGYYRNSHNNYRNSHYSGGGSGASGGAGGEPYNGGESEGYFPPSSRPYAGRFRKSRSYPASNYYYPNGKSGGGNSDNINRPSYNQDEYTKITTPRQDVLFKKGYLSQKKTQPSSSSVDSASAATTPSASTNGTPDTQSTNGINSDNSEGYENGETDYVIPYDDTIYYAPPCPPEAVFTDPNTGQVYYGHCSTTGEYYDAYPVSPVMVAAGYPPVYYPMVPTYAPIEWNGVPQPMYPIVTGPPPPQLPPVEDSSLLSPGLQGLESSPATSTNPNTNSDTTSTPSAALPAGAAVATSPSADPSSNPNSAVVNTATCPGGGANPDDDVEEECDDSCLNKEGHGSDSGLDSGSSVGDEIVSSSATTSHGSSSGTEEECVGGTSGAKMIQEETSSNSVGRSIKHLKQTTSTSNNNNVNDSVAKKGNGGESGTGKEDNNNEGGGKLNKIVQDVEKLHLSKEKDEYSSSESVLSSASSTDSGKASPPTIKGDDHEHEETIAGKAPGSPNPSTSALSQTNISVPYSSGPMKGLTAMVISSQHPQHFTTTTAIAYSTSGGPHPQAIPVAAGPVMTTLPLQVGCPPVMIAAAPNGMPLPPLVPAAQMHHMTHPPPPPPQNGGPVHHQPHPHHHGGHPNHGPHSHHPHHNHHMHHHPPQHHQSHHHNHQHGPPPPVHHSNYSHHNHHGPRHHGPNNHSSHQNSQGQQHHQMHPPPPPPQVPNLPPSQGAPQGAQQPQHPPTMGSAGPPPGTTPYHVYPHPTAYVYGPPVYNDEGSTAAAAATTNISTICASIEDPNTNFKGEEELSKGKMKTTSSTEEKGDTSTLVTEEQQNHNGVEREEEETRGISQPLPTKKELAVYEAEGGQSRVTGLEGVEMGRESCDLENIIASKEFGEKTVNRGVLEEGSKDQLVKRGLGLGLQLPKTSSSNSYATEVNEEIAGSLTVESLNEMNKEIEIRQLSLEMSGADEKVGGTSFSHPPQVSKLEEGSVGVEVGSEAATAVLTSSFPSSTPPSSSNTSSPSSANESSTSSPVNDSRSLMRSQSKLASKKKVTNDVPALTEKNIGESCNVERKQNQSNSKKRQKKNSASNPSNSSNGDHKSNNNKRTETSNPLNLLESDHRKNKKGKAETHYKKQMDNNGDETSKPASSTHTTTDETSQEGGQESQNQMTSSNESGQLAPESCGKTSTTSNQEKEEVNTLGNCEDNISSSTSTASKKPTDLTVQCPVTSGSDEGQYEALKLQQSPSLANEPSSPDSLNTNQSVAGSEFAPGENLSVSETDFMNRTTSIDEIEEDLPQEEMLIPVMGNEQVPVSNPANNANLISNSNEKDLDKDLAKAEESVPSASTTALIDSSQNSVITLEEKSNEITDLGHNNEGLDTGGGAKAQENDDRTTAEEAIKSTTTSLPKASPSSTSDSSEGKVEQGKGEEVPSRPQSITLAVTEWLKTQGDDALTPIIVRGSSSDEFEGDVEETTDSDDEDFDDDDENQDGSGKKRDDKGSALEQNQKNVYGNPWVAPSNKSGSSIGKAIRRRSGSKKSALKVAENEGSRIGIPKSDGVCSRVAPLSSNKSTASASVESILTKNCSNKHLTAQNSTCSTSTTSDDQDETSLTDNYSKHLNSTESGSKLLAITKRDKLRLASCTQTVKDYDSGLELSSPENSSSSVSSKPNLHTHLTNDINYKSNASTDFHFNSSHTVSALIIENSDNGSCPIMPRRLEHFINTDQVVIAAPLTIVETHSTKPSSCSYNKTGKEGERKECESSPTQIPSPSSLSNNNTEPVLLSSGKDGFPSPGSVPNSFTSLEERDHAEICDPQRYAKYYQFGVVFDTSDDPDQGIDTAAEEDGEMDSLDDITLDSPPPSISSTPRRTHSAERDKAKDKGEQYHQPQQQEQQKDSEDFLAIMIKQNRKFARKAKRSGDSAVVKDEEKKKEKYNNSDVLVSKSVYLQDQDEEIGTFDPKVVLEERLRRASSSGRPSILQNAHGDDDNNANNAKGEVTTLPLSSVLPPHSQQPHLYINPLSLAAELSSSEMVKVGMKTKGKKKVRLEDDTSSLDSSSSEEPPLPPYESPPSVEIPVYNANTPAARTIRQNFYTRGDPVSGAICCSIQ